MIETDRAPPIEIRELVLLETSEDTVVLADPELDPTPYYETSVPPADLEDRT